jgi:hypothetical protein
MGDRMSSRKSLLLSCSALIPALLVAANAQAQAVNTGGAGNLIIPDGRTKTTISTSGKTTDIRTNTVRGKVGFNSFSQFKAGAGNSVNMHLPDSTNTLVNVVRNGPVVVEGTVNALKNGTIGGNVVFSDPYGFVLGKDGVINTGSLTVNTPTKEFLDRAIDADGNIDTAVTDRLISGDVPISPDGSVVIKGRVNAQSGIDVNAQTVDVQGGKLKRHRKNFEATVNTQGGLVQGGALVVRDGSVKLVAAGDVQVSGRISASAAIKASASAGAGKVSVKAAGKIDLTGRITARGPAKTKGNGVDLKAGTDIALGAKSVIDTTSRGSDAEAGDIYVVATRDLAVADGARVTARGTGNERGGFVELSGHRNIALGKVAIDLRSAGTGAAGSLLIDPTDLVVDNASTYVRGAVGSIIDNVGEVSLLGDSITVTSTGRIDSRLAGANALDIKLAAKTITVQQGGSIRADAAAGYTSGNVTLTATDTHIIGSLKATSAASITVAGEVRGKDVVFAATSESTSSATDALFDDPAGAVGSMTGEVLGGLILGLQGGYVAADGAATIDIQKTAVVAASGNLTMTASGSQTASNLGINVSLLSPVQMTAFFGEIKGRTSVDVRSGAQISSGGDMSLIAKNTAKLGVNAMSVGLQDVPVSGAVAVGLVDVETSAIVHSGAVVTPAKNLTILADNTNSFSVTATSMALGSGIAGVGVAVQVADVDATARLGADVGTAGAKVGNVSVSAVSDTLLNKTQGSTTVGDSLVIKTLRGLAPASLDSAKIASKVYGLSALASLTPAETIKGGFGISYVESSQAADASIAADTTPTSASGWAPSVVSSGNVAVISSVYDSQIRSDASASINSNEEGTSQSPTATTAVGVALAIGQFEHISHATIGQNVSIKAAHVGVSATSTAPLVFAYDVANTPVDMLKAVIGAINGNGGVINNVVTSYSATDVAARDIGIAGAVNFLAIGHDTLAWVASGAKIETTSTGSTLPVGGTSVDGWDATLGSDGDRGTAQTQRFLSGLDVRALSSTSTVNIAGNPAWFVAFGGNEGQGGEGTSGGGSLNLNLFASDTVSGIGAGVTVNSASSVHVSAEMSDDIVAVAPTSGKGAAFGFNGLMSYIGIDNHTSASVSNLAKVTTAALTVAAQQNTKIVSITGSLAQSTGSSVGLAASWSNMETDTQAFIGDNAGLVAGTAQANLTGYGAGEIKSDDVKVKADTSGANYTLSVAAAVSAPETGEAGVKSKITNKINDSVVGGLSNKFAPSLMNAAGGASKIKSFFSGGMISALNKVSDKLTTPPAPGQTRSFSLAGAGSVSGVTTSFDTNAYIDGATISKLNGLGTSISVVATNDLLISTTSGSASVALAGKDSSQKSAAVAGAFAIAFTDNQTQAAIRNTVAASTSGVAVKAIASGQQIVLGLGIAANTNANSAASVAGSISFGGSTDGVNALVENSSLTRTASGDRDVEVLAYQNTDIGIGGLAVSVSTKGGGFGLAITATVIADPSGGKAASARIVNSALNAYRNVNVEAITVSRVMSGAGSVGVTPNGFGLNGAIVFNDISPTTLAEIVGSDGSKTVEVTGDVTVKAGSERRVDIEAELAKVIRNKTIDAGFDFSKSVFGTHDTGAVIFGVAGTVGVGQTNAGFALEYGGIRHAHEARISGVTVKAGGDVAVVATDKAAVFGSAAGVSVGTGGFAGAGSISVNVINNTTLAEITGATTKVSGRDIAVASSNASYVGGGAGAVAVSVDGAGTGLALINNTIANATTSNVTAAALTASRDVIIGATSSGELITFAVSVGVGGTAGIGGSIANSIALNDAKAMVRGANIDAGNNVAVLATNHDTINAVAGAAGIGLQAAGVGVSVVANIVRGETSATVGSDSTGSATVITTRANGNGRDVDSGIATSDFNYSGVDVAKSLVTLLPDLSNTKDSINGLAVVASSSQSVGSASLAVSAAINVEAGVSIAASVSPVVNVLGGTTLAEITGASINASGADNALADVAVIATSTTFAQNFVVSAAGSTGAAAASGFVSNIMERETSATVSNATIGSGAAGVGDVLVRATGRMDSLNIVVGAAIGPVGGAGSMIVNVFDADTTAQLAGGSVTARSLTVDGRSRTGFLGAAGAGALGAGVAVAGAMNVSVNLGSTSALVGDGSRDTTLVLIDDLDVTATSYDKQMAYVVGAAVDVGGGGVGVAGMLNFSVLMSDTIASVNRITASSMQNMLVSASNTIELTPVTGGFGASISGAGVGAAANVMLTKSMAGAEIINSSFTARGAVDVLATGLRTISMTTATLGAGGSVGLAGSIGIIVAGIGMSDEASDELHGTFDSANAQANQSTNSQFVDAETPGARDTSGDTRKDLITGSLASEKQDSVVAKISNTTMTAAATTVIADSKIQTSNLALGFGIGGVGGAGAALGFTFVNQNVAASASGTLTVSSLSVKALSGMPGSDPALSVKSYAGAGALGGALGAAVAMASVESDVSARVGGSITLKNTNSTVQVLAEDKLAVNTEAVGAAAAIGAAIGVSAATSEKDATVTAEITGGAALANAGTVTVKADGSGAVKANAKAGAGGLYGAGVGAGATAEDTSNITARIGANATLSGIGTGGVQIAATATPQAEAKALGVAVSGGLAVGASVATTTVDQTVLAEIGNGASVTTAGALKVQAATKLASPSATTAYADATAGSGAIYAALQATFSKADTTTKTRALVGTSVSLDTGSADVTVAADTATRQISKTTGVSVGGLALGANIAEANSDTTTSATIGTGSAVDADDLNVTANGNDENRVYAVAGAGGLIAGSAANASTNTVSNTTASLGSKAANGSDHAIDLSGKLTVSAKHTDTVGGTVDSVNAGLVGASSANISHTVDATVDASLAANTDVAARAFDLIAHNTTHKFFEGEGAWNVRGGGQPPAGFNPDNAAWDVNSGSGGLVSVPAGSVAVTVSHTTRATMGTDAKVAMDRIAGQTSVANLEAYNEIIAHGKGKLDTGGAVSVANTSATLNVVKNQAAVSFGLGSSIKAGNGNINAAAWDNAHLDLRAVTTTYGLAGAPMGDAKITYNRANTVDVLSGSVLEANSYNDAGAGKLSLTAGAGLDRTLSRIFARATVDLFNKTAIPISTTPDARTTISGNSELRIAGASNGRAVAAVRAAGDIDLYASRGNIDASAVGTGKDIYREALAALASGISNLFGGGDVTFDYKGGQTNVTSLGIADVDGSVLTGIARSKALTVEYAQSNVGTCLVSQTACLSAPVAGQIGYTFRDGVAVGTAIIERLKELRRLLADYSADPVAKGAFSAEIAFLEAKLIAAGFSKDGTAGEAYAESDHDAAVRLITALGFAISSLDKVVVDVAGVVTTSAATGVTAGTTLAGNGTTITTGLSSTATKAGEIKTALQGLTKYGVDANKAANTADMTAIETALTGNAGLSTAITTSKASIDTSRTRISTAQGNITAKLTEISDAQAAIAALGATPAPASVKVYQDKIQAAQSSIYSSTATIETELAAISTATSDISAKSAQIKTNIDTITAKQSAILGRSVTADNAGDTTHKATVTAGQTAITGYQTSISSGFTTLATGAQSVTTALGNLKAPDGTTTSAKLSATNTTRAGYSTDLAAKQVALPGLATTVSGGPTIGEITVEDTTVRLGNINVVADRLEGSGVLAAPGDASITIVNRTANNLQLGNLTVDGDSGGRLRLNGVLVNSNADINTLNGSSAASFATITTAQTQGNTRPVINVRNEYNSDNLAYYDPELNKDSGIYNATKAAANTLKYKTLPSYAPDLVVKQGSTLFNTAGSVVLFSEQGNIYQNGSIQAGSASITAKNGDFVQSYTYGVQHVAGDPQEGLANGTGIVANGAVAISARYLNINGVIQSGMEKRFVTIGTNPTLTASASALGVNQATLTGFDTAYKNAVALGQTATEVYDLGGGLKYRVTKGERAGRLEFDITYARDHKAQLGNDVLLATTDQAGKTTAEMQQQIGVSYDIANNRFVVDGTNVRGGYIQLYGQVLNTSSNGGGNLRVLDGYGQIEIANLNSRDVVIGRLDTGEDPTGTGRGTQGVINITDIRSVVPGAGGVTVTAVNSIYTREWDSATNAYRVVNRATLGHLADDGSFVAEANQSGYGTTYGTNRNDTYDPQTGLRYIYLAGTDSSLKVITHYKGTQFFGSSDLQTAPTGTIQSQYSYTLNAYALRDAATVAIDVAHAGSAKVESSTTYNSSATTYVKTDEWRQCNWWTLCIAASYNYIIEATTPQTTISTTSLKADYAIGVQFIGSDTGSVTVKGAGNVLLAGAINNGQGTTKITADAGNIVQANGGAIITAKNVDLSASGSVGGLNAGEAVRVSINGGKLDASAGNGNVVVDASSALHVGTVSAAGDVGAQKGRVVLTAAGSITADAASKIQAPRVELTSKYGAIGSLSQQLTVNTGYTATGTTAALALNGYSGLKATAAGDIGIKSGVWSGNADGTILVDQVTSAGGSVKLSSPGAILDNNPNQSIDTRTYAELLNYWNSLGLTAGAENTAKTDAQIAALETSKTASYRTYWQLRAEQADNGAVYDAGFAYTMSDSDRAGFAAGLRLSEPSLSDAEVNLRIAQFETERTATYHRLQTEVGGVTAAFDSDYAYAATDGEKAAIRQGSTWTDRELAFSLSAGALKTVTGTNPVIKAANVSGRTVTIEAGKAIGGVSGDVLIPTSLDPSQLTDAQKIALATAERGDISSDGKTITISMKSPLNFDARDQLNVTVAAATGHAYLASMSDARLGTISVPGELRLKVRGSIVNANAAAPAVSAGAYILEAANGGIGTFRAADGSLTSGTLRIKPVNTGAVTGGYAGTIIARAADSVDVTVEGREGEAASGDANVDTIYSRASVKVTAAGSIRNANGDGFINVLGDTVSLAAVTGSIGSADARLNVGNGLTGFIDAVASKGSIFLNGVSGQRFVLNNVTAGKLIDVAAAGEALVSGDVTSTSGTTFTVAGRLALTQSGFLSVTDGALAITASSLRMLTGSGAETAGAIQIATTGDAQVTNLTSKANSSVAILVEAGGRIVGGTEQGRSDLTAAGVKLTAKLGIGDRRVANATLGDAASQDQLNYVRISAASIVADTLGGSLAIQSLGVVDTASLKNQTGALVDVIADADFTAQSVTATAGSVQIAAASDLAVTAMAAGRNVLTEAGDTASFGTVTTGGNQNHTAGSSITFGALTATGTKGAGDIMLVSRTGSLIGGTITAKGAATADAGADITLATLTAYSAEFDALGAIKLVNGTVAGLADLTAGTALGWTALAAGDATFVSGTDMTGGTLTVARGADLTAGGDLKATTVTAGVDVTTDVAGATTFGSVTSGSNQVHTAGNSLTFGALAADGTTGAGDITLLSRTGSLNGGTITAKAAANGTAGADIGLDSLISDSAAFVAGGAIEVVDGTVAGLANISAGTTLGWTALKVGQAAFTSGTNMTGGTIAAAQGVRLNAGGNLAATAIAAGIDVATDVTGTTTFGSVTSGSNQVHTAGRDITFGALMADGTTGAGEITLLSRTGSLNGRTITAKAAVAATADADIGVDNLASNAAQLSSGGAIRIGTGMVTDLADFTAGTSLAFDRLNLGSAGLVSGRDMSGGSLDVARQAALSVGGSLQLDRSVIGGAITASAGDRMVIGQMQSGGTQRLTARNDLVFDFLKTLGIAGDVGDVRLTSTAGAVRGGSVDAHGSIFVDARTGLSFGVLRAGNDIGLAVGGDVTGDTIEAGGEIVFDLRGSNPVALQTVRSQVLNLRSAGSMTIAQAFIGDRASFQTPDIKVGKLTYTGQGELGLSITGMDASVGRTADMSIDAPRGINISTLRVNDSRFVANAEQVRIVEGFVPGTLRLETPWRVVWMDNVTPVPTLNSDTQLYQPDYAFSLDQLGARTTTNTYVVRYGHGSDIRMVAGDEVYLGTSLIRDYERLLQDPSNQPEGQRADRALQGFSLQAIMDLFRRNRTGSVINLFDGPAVNTGGKDDEEASLH